MYIYIDLPIQPGFSLENKTCAWKHGHGRH